MDEIRLSMAAHLMAALTLEGAANEVCQSVLQPAEWNRVEKVDVILKWLLVSRSSPGDPFLLGKEPLQTVDDLYRLRNVLVHVKPTVEGADIIVRRPDATLEFHAKQDTIVKDGDQIFIGLGPTLQRFRASTARRAVRRVFAALKTLKVRTQFEGFRWLESEGESFAWLRETE